MNNKASLSCLLAVGVDARCMGLGMFAVAMEKGSGNP